MCYSIVGMMLIKDSGHWSRVLSLDTSGSMANHQPKEKGKDLCINNSSGGFAEVKILLYFDRLYV